MKESLQVANPVLNIMKLFKKLKPIQENIIAHYLRFQSLKGQFLTLLLCDCKKKYLKLEVCQGNNLDSHNIFMTSHEK